MSQVLMKKNKLVVLCARTRAQTIGKIAVTSVLRGGELVASELETPYSMLGLGSTPDFAASSAWPPALTDDILAQASYAATELEPGAPLWLHISRDSPMLAILPWESNINRLTGRQLIRLPNFVDDPFEPTKTPVVAVCISFPSAKMPAAPWDQDLVRAELQVLRTLAQDAVSKLDVHIFGDAERVDALRELIGTAQEDGRASIQLHEPYPPEGYVVTRGGPGIEWGENQFLSWMGQVLREKSVDIVHFICPGFQSGARGALAFAQSPAENLDRAWSRFVGANELVDFLDRLGVSAVSFTHVGQEHWRQGLLLLAFELGWMRPGPIVVTSADAQASNGLQKAFEILYGFGDGSLQGLGSTQLGCHPRYFASPYDSLGSVDDFGMNDIADGLLRNDASMSFGSQQVSRVGSRATVRGRSLPNDSGGGLLERRLRQSEAALGKVQANTNYQSWEMEGAANALKFVRELLAQKKPDGQQ